MNILIIDDMLLPEFSKANSFEKKLFLKAAEENFKRRFLFSKELQNLGANILLARLELCKADSEISFEYRENGGISQLFVKIPAKQSRNFLRKKELLKFGNAVYENAPSLAGIFNPDIVISAGLLPISVFAGERIADISNSVLITELSCSSEIPRRFRLCSSFDAVLIYLKKSVSAAFLKSSAVFTFFPKANRQFFGAHNLYPMALPSFFDMETNFEKAVLFKEKLASFKNKKNFVLAVANELENGFSLEELIISASSFENELSLVFIFEGSKKPYFKRFVAERGITNVFFGEDFPKENPEIILSGADGVFVAESDLSKGLFPLYQSFWNALGAQKPVIAVSEHDSEFFKKAGGVIITKPRRRDSISLGIKTLLSMSESDREILGLSNREFYEKNSLKNFAKESFSLFDNLVKQKEIKK